MKSFLFLALTLPASLWAFQKTNTSVASQPGGPVTLICKMYATSMTLDSMFVYESIGLAKKVVARAGRPSPDSAFVLTVPASAPKIYLVGANELNTVKVILGGEKEVKLWGNGEYMQKSRTMNSKANTGYEKLAGQVTAMQTEGTQLRGEFNASSGSARPTAESRLKVFGKNKAKLLDSLKRVNPLLWSCATLQITPDYMGKGDEKEFYGKEYFANATLTDKIYEGNPEVFSAFETYTTQLLNLCTSHDQAMPMIEAQLAKIPAESSTYRMALGGVLSALKTVKSGQFAPLAKKYIDQYPNSIYGDISRLRMDLRIAETLKWGTTPPPSPAGGSAEGTAPELEGLTPENTPFTLSELRGKVVMVDFWASWCRPCRMENPNVVANFAKYKDKGFDILGVSLDRTADAWKKAIADDGLTWHHISDLKGWQSAHAALYSITSIPQTLLIDRDGKIIARNLRGEQLSEKLKEIFGM